MNNHTNQLPVNRTYKARIFEMLYEDKKELLDLYNAINETCYDDPEELEINTLENAVYLSMRNDVSFVIGCYVSLYEHQSTFSPNLPLRFYNEKLKKTCKSLGDYCEYTRRVRQYAKDWPIEEAVERAITECIKEGILAEFLSGQRAEAKKVSIYEYDEEKHMRMEREQSYATGKAEGIELGKVEGIIQERDRMNQLILKLTELGRLEDITKAAEDPEYEKKLLEEVGMQKK